MTHTDYQACAVFCSDLIRRGVLKAGDFPTFKELLAARGGIVGQAVIAGVSDSHPSPWFVGYFGFWVVNAKPLPFHPCKGALKFFEAHHPQLSIGGSSV
jgi:hypothetical protein